MGKLHALKILIIGPQRVGKTSLARRIVNQEPTLEYKPTIGVDFLCRMIPSLGVKLHVWDLSGDQRFENISKSYISTSKYILLVYDTNDIRTLNNLMRKFLIYQSENLISDQIILVIGNNVENTTSNVIRDGIDFSCSIKAKHIATSAKENINIDAIVVQLLNREPTIKLRPKRICQIL